jgi:hypothetical protein
MALTNGEMKFRSDRETDDVVADAIVFINSSWSRKIDENMLSLLECSYATELAIMKFHKMVELSVLEHDGVAISPDSGLEKFSPDGEPMPSSIDSWARGSGVCYSPMIVILMEYD